MPTIPYKNKAGRRLRGATTHIGQNIGWGKDGLIYWANEQGRNGLSLDEARDTATIPGTMAHAFIEHHLLGGEFDVSKYSEEDKKKAEVSFYEFLRWEENYKIKPVAVEPHLVSESFQFGGTPDLIAETRGGLALIDWKTGKIYSSIFLQLVAYKILWEENHPDKKITGGYHVLRIPRNENIPSFHHSYWESLPNSAAVAFECALQLTQCEQVLKKLL